MSDRQHVVLSAGYWFKVARDHQNQGQMAEAIECMENAYNHVENALVAAHETLTDAANLIKCLEVRSWPPGHDLKRKVLARIVALTSRDGKPPQRKSALQANDL